MVGRSLGRMVGSALLERYPHLQKVLGYQATDFGSIVATACLAHDIETPLLDTVENKPLEAFFHQAKERLLALL